MNWVALVAIIACLLCVYVVGTIIISPFREKKCDLFYDTFLCLIAGFISVTTVYAIVKTGGNTIQLGFLILGVFCIIEKKIKKDTHHAVFKMSLVGISTACILGVLFFFYYALFFYNTPINNLFHTDYYVYAFNSYNNQDLGIEFSGVYLEGMSKATPYHYTEGWFCALIANIFKINYLETFSICLHCVFSSIVIMGIIGFARTYTDKYAIIVIACFSIFLSAVLIDYSPIRQSVAMGGNIKYLLGAMFVVGFMISVRSGKTNYLWLLCLPIVNAALAPIIMSSLFIFAFFLYKFDRSRINLVCNLVEVFVIGIFLVSFYAVQQNNFPKTSSLDNLFPTLISCYTFSDFFHMAYRTIVNYAMYLPYFIPLIILFAIKRKNVAKFFKEHSRQLIFILISAICGLICHYLYYPINNYDSGQLDTLVNMMIMNVMVLTGILFVFQNIEHKISIAVMYAFFIIVCAYNFWTFTESIISRRIIASEKVDEDYQNNILCYFSEHNISRIGARFSPSDLPGSFYVNTCDIYLMRYIGGSIDGLAAVCLSPLSLSDEQSHWNSIVPQSNTFNDYLAHIEKPYDLDSVQIDFINKYNLGYIVVHPQTELSNGILSIVDTTFTNSKTGERFAFLKK